MEATARQNLQLVANPAEHVYQPAAVMAATDLLSDLVDETLGPMSHPGSI